MRLITPEMSTSRIFFANDLVEGYLFIHNTVIDGSIRRATTCIDIFHFNQCFPVELKIDAFATNKKMTVIRIVICVFISPNSSSTSRLLVKSFVSLPELVSNVLFFRLLHYHFNSLFERFTRLA